MSILTGQALEFTDVLSSKKVGIACMQ